MQKGSTRVGKFYSHGISVAMAKALEYFGSLCLIVTGDSPIVVALNWYGDRLLNVHIPSDCNQCFVLWLWRGSVALLIPYLWQDEFSQSSITLLSTNNIPVHLLRFGNSAYYLKPSIGHHLGTNKNASILSSEWGPKRADRSIDKISYIGCRICTVIICDTKSYDFLESSPWIPTGITF